MGYKQGCAAGLAVLAVLAARPAAADTLAEARELRQLDIMLMVTGLRCRTTADDFQADYGRFTTAHFAELNGAANQLKEDFSQQFGAAGSHRALDRLSVTIANSYGQGHPWLDCAQLKQVTRELAAAPGRSPLVEAAARLLASQPPPRLAVAGQ